MRKKYILQIFYLTLFLVLTPATRLITYEQNDEWVYYENIRRFISRDFQLSGITAPSFYSAGIPAYLVARIAGINKIPVLTLFVSVFSGYVLSRILYEHYKKPWGESILYSMFLLLNPLFVYSAWGFMTDNYALFYALLSTYFYQANKKDKSTRNLIFGGVFAFLAFNTRQIYLVLPISFSLESLYKKEYKGFLYATIATLIILIYYYVLFPKTPEMFDNSLNLSRVTYFQYAFSLAFIILIYLSSLLLPLVISYIQQNFDANRIKRELVYIVMAFALFIVAGWYFNPGIIWKDKYYYLINTVQGNGFLVDNIHGTKPRFHLSSALYQTLDYLGKVFGIYLVVKLLARFRLKLIDQSAIFTFLYFLMLLISPKIHDRYLIPLFAFGILFIAKNVGIITKTQKLIISTFLIFMGIYSYNFSADYIITNRFVWSESQRLVEKNEVKPGEIVSTISWNLKHPSIEKGYDYKFTYDSPDKQNYSTEHEIIEFYDIYFPLSFWDDTRIFLYKYTGFDKNVD